MSQLAKRITAMLQASCGFRNFVETLPFQGKGSDFRQRLKQIEDYLDTIKRERTLILSEPLPATYPTTDRNGWEYDVLACVPKLEKKCDETLQIALEGQKRISAAPNDPIWSNIQLEMRNRCRDLDELGKKIVLLRDAIDEATLIEADMLTLMSSMLQAGEGFVNQGHFDGILQRHDAHHQKRFLIHVFVDRGYLKPAHLHDGIKEDTWTIVADAIKVAIERGTPAPSSRPHRPRSRPPSPLRPTWHRRNLHRPTR